ncbi:HK97 gp10 family phage protein [Evansella vedderi]|uniref:HK97 gp10 family phage protein n=1 Tax=Evansella vedderi TaxID=38282 RepID=A0ABT9ZUL6_9BACI|nr:HK97 gp10 family phage protein [Evansella vedderi]MDQ0254927.1 HK97 gp10 family phage protein [Evansella vedderi]
MPRKKSKVTFQNNIPKFKKQYKENKGKLLTGIGEHTLSNVQLRSPVSSSALRDSYNYKTDEAKGEVILGSSAEHAPYVEFGTGKYAEKGDGRKTPWAYEDPKTGEIIFTHGMRPQPTLRPAADDTKGVIKQLAATIMKM